MMVSSIRDTYLLSRKAGKVDKVEGGGEGESEGQLLVRFGSHARDHSRARFGYGMGRCVGGVRSVFGRTSCKEGRGRRRSRRPAREIGTSSSPNPEICAAPTRPPMDEAEHPPSDRIKRLGGIGLVDQSDRLVRG